MNGPLLDLMSKIYRILISNYLVPVPLKSFFIEGFLFLPEFPPLPRPSWTSPKFMVSTKWARLLAKLTTSVVLAVLLSVEDAVVLWVAEFSAKNSCRSEVGKSPETKRQRKKIVKWRNLELHCSDLTRKVSLIYSEFSAENSYRSEVGKSRKTKGKRQNSLSGGI